MRPWLERALPEDRHVDRVAVRPSSPQEDEIPLANIQQLSVFHALYFPKRFQRHIDRGVFFDGCTAAEIATWCRSVRTFVAKIVLHQGKRLCRAPLDVLQEIHEQLRLPDWDLAHDHVKAFSAAERKMSLKEKLIKIGAKVVTHGRYVAFQMAEVAVSRTLFAEILGLIAELRPPPDPAPA